MGHILKATSLSLLTALFVACAGSAELPVDSDPTSPLGSSEQALSADDPEGGASCEVAGQTFPDGSTVPSGDCGNTCFCVDGSVLCQTAGCPPVQCAQYVEEPDGVCRRFPLDPCKFQDPDCG